MKTLTTVKVPTQEEFLRSTNKRARVRVFNEQDYRLFVSHVRDAEKAAALGAPYYWEANTGSVSNSYKYCAETARMGVYTTLPLKGEESGCVCMVFDRVRTSVNVKCIYYGGERSYFKWFNSREGWF